MPNTKEDNIENAPAVPTYARDSRKYVEFCNNCGSFLTDGMQMWRDALKAMGISDGTIEIKLASAAKLIRVTENLKPNNASIQDAFDNSI
jgi:hypothetical protein